MTVSLVKAPREIDAPRPPEKWCVVTDADVTLVVAYAGNGGFGPVNVWHEGTLVPVKYRHAHGEMLPGTCHTCAPDGTFWAVGTRAGDKWVTVWGSAHGMRDKRHATRGIAEEYLAARPNMTGAGVFQVRQVGGVFEYVGE